LILQQTKYFIEAEQAIMQQIKKLPVVDMAIRRAE
jgi:hypothetical protein